MRILASFFNISVVNIDTKYRLKFFILYNMFIKYSTKIAFGKKIKKSLKNLAKMFDIIY